MANYSVTITNGSGTQAMQNGTYTVSLTSATGYDITTISPTTYTVSSSGSATGTFTVSATGTLTFNVNETGASGGTAITSGTMIMTNSSGDTEYGTSVNIDSSGNAVFNNVPYGDSTTPFTLYFKQLTTDDNHNIYSGVITVNMASSSQTEYVQNNPIATQTFTLNDANYSGLTVPSAVLSFTTST